MRAHELFGPLLRRVHTVEAGTAGARATALRRGGLLAIDAHGGLVYNSGADAWAVEWVWAITHLLTHLGFGHTDPAHRDGRGSYTPEWRAASCLVVDRFLRTLHIPGTPAGTPGYDGDEEELARRFAVEGIPSRLAEGGPAGGGPDLWEDLFGGRSARPAPTQSPLGRAFAVGLEEELLARGQSLPWDMGLAAWFDQRFPALEAGPTLALPPGRPVAASYDPRPAPPLPEALGTTRTFGVLLDTSGAMDERLVGRALGSIASSAAAGDVRHARILFCDARVHDAGWLSPQQLAGHATVRGRGGPALQPGVDLLLADPAFPPDGPILLVTGGRCDQVRVFRDHAWMTSAPLSFTPRGPVFQLC